jgi:tellurite resistance protein
LASQENKDRMPQGPLADREKALEDLFFDKQNRELVEKLRAEREAESHREALASVTGLKDEALLDKLVGLDLRPETWAALSLVPLVEVAWADGSIDPKERVAVLSAAEANGVTRGSAPFQLLEQWLEERPAAGYLEAWGASIVALCRELDESERGGMKREVLGRAQRVAEAAGGFMGLGSKTSADEQRVLDELARAFGD